MYPHEAWTRGMLVQPFFRVRYDIFPAALHTPPARRIFFCRRKIIVEIKTAVEARCQSLAIEHHRADKRCRSIAGIFQQRSQRGIRRVQPFAKVCYAMRRRNQAGQNRGMRRTGDRAWRERIREANAFGRQLIESRSLVRRVSVAMEMIGPQSVYGDQENITLRGRCGCALTRIGRRDHQQAATNHCEALHVG